MSVTSSHSWSLLYVTFMMLAPCSGHIPAATQYLTTLSVRVIHVHILMHKNLPVPNTSVDEKCYCVVSNKASQAIQSPRTGLLFLLVLSYIKISLMMRGQERAKSVHE